MPFASYRQSGFTLIELVVIILLLSIISVYAASRYSGTSSFSAFAAQEQAISIIRQIQLSRMQSNVSGTVSTDYQLRVSSDCLGSVSSCTSTTNSRSNRLILPQDVSFAQTMTVEFDLLGNPSCASGACPANFKIDISDSGVTASVCINSQGYVYAC